MTKTQSLQKSAKRVGPSASDFTSSPLRNRIRLELDAPVCEVWELIGDLSRFPEYSVGLERVDVELDEGGRCIGYTCYFKPLEEGAEGAMSRDASQCHKPGCNSRTSAC